MLGRLRQVAQIMRRALIELLNRAAGIHSPSAHLHGGCWCQQYPINKIDMSRTIPPSLYSAAAADKKEAERP